MPRSEALAENDIVIVKEKNTPPARWKLARTVDVHLGKDGVIRVATIRMSNGLQTTKSVVKLCHLPIQRLTSVKNFNFQRGEYVKADNDIIL